MNMPTPSIQWRIHLAAAPYLVYQALTTDQGRARFWAESTHEHNGMVTFVFPGGITWQGRIHKQETDQCFQLEYYGGTLTTFTLAEDDVGGTELHLHDEGVAPEDHAEVLAGWVSVLLTLKAALDFGVDLRNHDPHRTWNQGYADN